MQLGKAFKWVTLGYSHSVGHFLKKPYRTNCYNYNEYNFKSRQDCKYILQKVLIHRRINQITKKRYRYMQT